MVNEVIHRVNMFYSTEGTESEDEDTASNASPEISQSCFQNLLPKHQTDKTGTSLSKIFITSFKAVARMKGTKKNDSKPIEQFLLEMARETLTRFSLKQIKSFTTNFQIKIGMGGFGTVYKGLMPNGVYVAVKMLRYYGDEEFLAEVRTIGKTYHRNLIKLHGFCYDADTIALVYEFVENGPLDNILFQNHLNLEFEQLFDIATQTARGISYLHEDCPSLIIHFDIKPANVLIDSSLCPKVADFGLAKLCSTDSSHVSLPYGRGTRGYTAPELRSVSSVKCTSKCDVYSFGVMLFEFLRRKRNTVNYLGRDQEWFPDRVWRKFKEGQLDALLTECVVEDKNRDKAKRLSMVALTCAQYAPKDRPSMSKVVKILEGEIGYEGEIESILASNRFPLGFPSAETSSSSDGYFTDRRSTSDERRVHSRSTLQKSTVEGKKPCEENKYRQIDNVKKKKEVLIDQNEKGPASLNRYCSIAPTMEVEAAPSWQDPPDLPLLSTSPINLSSPSTHHPSSPKLPSPPLSTSSKSLSSPKPSSSTILTSSHHIPNPPPQIEDFPSLPLSQHTQSSNLANLQQAKSNGFWFSLFKTKPPSSGSEELSFYEPNIKNGAMEFDEETLEEGAKEWEDKVVGFFIDKKLPYSIVKPQVEKKWKLNGGVDVALDGETYYFTFTNPQDREQVIGDGSFYMLGKLFIIRPWTREFEENGSKIQRVPLWVKIHKVPKHLWNAKGLSKIASFIGKPLFLDKHTKLKSMLSFARVCIDIVASKPLPNSLPIKLKSEKVVVVEFEYAWKPLICPSCKTFGHLPNVCGNAPKNLRPKGNFLIKDTKVPSTRWKQVLQGQREETLVDLGKNQVPKVEEDVDITLATQPKESNRFAALRGEDDDSLFDDEEEVY